MMKVLVRPMTADDIAAVAFLERCALDGWNENQLAEELAAPFAVCLVACAVKPPAAGGQGAQAPDGISDDGAAAALPPDEVLGFCSAQLAAGEATLNAVTVLPAHRGQGVGAQLLAALEAALLARGVGEIYLEVRTQNAPAIALYQKMGYQLTGRRPRFYTAPPDDAYTMKKELPQHSPAGG